MSMNQSTSKATYLPIICMVLGTLIGEYLSERYCKFCVKYYNWIRLHKAVLVNSVSLSWLKWINVRRFRLRLIVWLVSFMEKAIVNEVRSYELQISMCQSSTVFLLFLLLFHWTKLIYIYTPRYKLSKIDIEYK